MACTQVCKWVICRISMILWMDNISWSVTLVMDWNIPASDYHDILCKHSKLLAGSLWNIVHTFLSPLRKTCINVVHFPPSGQTFVTMATTFPLASALLAATWQKSDMLIKHIFKLHVKRPLHYEKHSSLLTGQWGFKRLDTHKTVSFYGNINTTCVLVIVLVKPLAFILNHMDDCPLIGCDSPNETVAPTSLLPLINMTEGAPKPAVNDSVLDFIKVKLFPIRQLLPLVRSMRACGL